VTSYETPQGEVKIKIDAVAATPEEARRVIIEAARLAVASDRHYDEGVGVPKTYKDLVEELKKLAGENYDLALKKTVEFFMTHAEDLADLAAQEGDLEAVDAVFNILREAGREVRTEAEERPAELVEKDTEALDTEASPYHYIHNLRAEEVVDSDEEVVDSEEEVVGGEEAAEADLEEEERRAREALRRLGIDLDELDKDVSHAEDLSKRYGIPLEVASDLVSELGPRGAEAVAEDFRRVDRWMREAGLSDEERAKILTERTADIVENPRRVIEELAERLAERAPKELRDLVAEDLKKGDFGDVNWKLSQVEKYCAAKGGCTPEERRGLYRRL